MSKRPLEGHIIEQVALCASTLTDPTPRAVRRKVEAALGLRARALDEHKTEIKDLLIARAEAADADADADGRPDDGPGAVAVAGDDADDMEEDAGDDDEAGASKTGKFSDAESKAIVAEAEKTAKTLGLTLQEMLDGAWKEKVGRGNNVWREIASTACPKRAGQSVYGHVSRVCDARKRKGRWSPQESEELRRLHKVHGPQWAKIAGEIGRTPGSCRDRFRTLFGEPTNQAAQQEDSFATGEWTAEEVDRLKRTNCNGVPIVQVDDATQVSWTQLAQRVRTRGRQACRRKWEELRDADKGKRSFRAHEQLLLPAELLELCEQLAKSKAQHESEVVWTDLGWDRRGCATAVALKRWKMLRSKYPPEISFTEALSRASEGLRGEVEKTLLKQWDETPAEGEDLDVAVEENVAENVATAADVEANEVSAKRQRKKDKKEKAPKEKPFKEPKQPKAPKEPKAPKDKAPKASPPPPPPPDSPPAAGDESPPRAAAGEAADGAAASARTPKVALRKALPSSKPAPQMSSL
ncbi:hypothetical protein M885DRAFT_541278 [Pelagophyceae sp. CCMP2097]|nr:hypothetical protein M885DRAFT_541278 [Pelagophyceae sp. CCMP2097]